MKLLHCIIFGLILSMTTTSYAANKQANIDDLMAKLMPLLNEEKVKQALPVFAQIEKLEPTLSEPLPEGFQFLYISTLDKAGDKAKTLMRSKAFMRKYGEASQYASQVTEIINRLEPNPSQTATAADSSPTIKIIKDCADCLEMVVIPGKSYSMGKFEVSQEQWESVMGSNPSKFKDCGKTCPVDSVSWNDAQEFIQKLNAKTGKQYRLPSEAEWEYACEAGVRPMNFCGSNEMDKVAWSSTGVNDRKKVHPSGQKLPNAFGLYDMSGNVSEFIQDCRQPDYCKSRRTKGGSWQYHSSLIWPTGWDSISYDDTRDDLGFRLVRLEPNPSNAAEAADSGNGTKDTGKIIKDCDNCPEMVVIPAGSFDMGGKDSNAQPVHHVSIGHAFELGKTEVTQGQWKAVMRSNLSTSWQCGDNCPVDSVSWNDAQEFIQKLNAKTGKQYRLPSEAEWEYACRAGGPQKYCGGKNIGSVAWYLDNSARTTHPVATKQANAWGLYDMLGNVWEWVEDSYHDNYNGAPTDGSVWQGDGAERVQRGGSWIDDNRPNEFAAFHRTYAKPNSTFGYYGFRLARTLP